MSVHVKIHGFCDPDFLLIQDAFIQNFEKGLELGASVSMMVNDELVVDLWAGFADRKRTRLWAEDTIVDVYSLSKIMITLCVMLLVDRMKLDLNAPVAEYWPEFAQQGKENILVRHIMGHSAGLPAWDDVHPFEDRFNWNRMVDLLSQQKPLWKPGEKSGYHSVTFGFLVGELVQRITGVTVGNFFRQEIAEKIGSDFYIGLPEEHSHRVAQIKYADTQELIKREGGPLMIKVMGNFLPGNTENREAQGAEMPGANGFGNARSITQVGAIIANMGKWKEKRLISRKTVKKIFEEQNYFEDLVFGTPVRFGLGIGLNSNEFPFPNPNTCYWGGLGGSICIMDADVRVCIAYAMNNHSSDPMSDPRNELFMNAFRVIVGQM